MKCKSKLLFCVMIGLLMTLSSCVRDSDVVQEIGIEPSPVLTSNLMFTSLDATSFIDRSTHNERAILTDTIYLEFSGSDFFIEDLSMINLSFLFTNSFEKDFKIDIEFYNDMDESKYVLHVPVSSSSEEKPSAVEMNVVIEIPELTTFMEATKFVYKITMIPNDTQLLSESKGTLKLQSEAIYFLDL